MPLRDVAFVLFSCGLLHGTAASSAEPITTRNDEVGKLLNQWGREFSAAGLSAITCENRDGQHSPLPLGQYPQLQIAKPSEAEKKAGSDKGVAQQLRTQPTLGNCSMSSKAEETGCIPRLYFLMPKGHGFLFEQYLHNNLIIYPEHEDYDLGSNGLGGWGDLLPANTATTLISQGSSFSDMPFLNAMLSTTAAFQPEVQRTLLRNRILIPTLQAIFRQSNKQVVTDEDYFTGKAHPPVFDGTQINELRMVNAAHLMSELSIPPLAFIEVLSEPKPRPGIDFFEPTVIKQEVLGFTPSNYARVYRSTSDSIELTVSAKRSVDLTKRVLTYRWVILQGDSKLIDIDTSDMGMTAKIRVRWHPPLLSTSGIRSHRVDIALFTNNGISASAPAILSFYMLPNERRFFDDNGHLSEVCYSTGDPDLGLPTQLTDERWLQWIELLASADTTLPQMLLDRVLKGDERKVAAKIWPELKAKKAALESVSAVPSVKDKADTMRKELATATAQAMGRGIASDDGNTMTLAASATRSIEALADIMELYPKLHRQIQDLAAKSPKASAESDLRTEYQRLKDWNVLLEEDNGKVTSQHSPETMSKAERWYLRCLNLVALSQAIYPTLLMRSPAPLYSTPLLTTAKTWRDVYRYDDKGERNGWLRYDKGRMIHFDAEGRMLSDDAAHAPKSVIYEATDGRLIYRVNDTP